MNTRADLARGIRLLLSQEDFNKQLSLCLVVAQHLYGLTVSDIKIDLTAGKGRPEWIFSCYGPGRNAPRQLFGGPQREMSFEELRLHHYEFAAAGNAEGAVKSAQNMYDEHVKQMEVILTDLNGAINYIIDGENEHPNRVDIVEGKTALSFSGFGKSPFGKPEEPTPPPDQMSGFGKLAQPGFGKPSGFGQPSFGQPAFGQPSAAGQAAFEKPAFGQPSFGQPAMGTTGFAVPQNTESPFAQMANKYQGQNTGFGQSASSISPFAQINQQSQPQIQLQPQPQPVAPSGFGFVKQPEQPAQPPNPFGQPVTAPSSFGTLQPQQSQTQQLQPQQQAPTQAQPPAVGTDAGARPSIRVDDPNELMPIPPLNGQTIRDPVTKKPNSWKGQPVKYIDNVPCYLHPQDQKTWVRIFFPDGPPDEASLRDAYGEADEYTPEVTEQYEFFTKNGYFKDGIVPSVPPKRENVSFDF
ncbi:hypothetical protein N8T08_001480 [Aspergillus melleus]|uniref:Uncharacterized protein n=1 Tax=Aspergillus melleus TaxID=138277 RepID=A0ACC3BB30_9EURO|nr:hypothetical protein N8T08_001480 [Aspergillus melleus]